MVWFVIGMLAGLAAAAAAAAIVIRAAYRRYALLQVRTRQAERLAELGTLTGGLAHEIKNPLSTVQLNLQLLHEDLPTDHPSYGRLSNRLNIAQRETSRLRDILDDFLRYAGKIELERKPVELNRMLEDMVDFFAPQAMLQHVQLRLRPSPEPLIIPADEKLLKQAVLNLLINGLQAINSDVGELILSVSRTQTEAVIDVIDTGSGIAPDALSRIFDAYYSTKKSGTGLGLAMTKRIAEEHGGRITIASEPGKGSNFAIHLPLA